MISWREGRGLVERQTSMFSDRKKRKKEYEISKVPESVSSRIERRKKEKTR